MTLQTESGRVAESKNVNPEDLKARIRKEFGTLKAMAEKYGLEPVTLRVALIKPCPKGQAVIANHYNEPKNHFWPEWYDHEDSRIFRPTETSKSRDAAHSQKAEEPMQKRSAA